MGRRGENIRKRADGRWEARIVQGRPVGGKTNYKYLYGRTYQDAKRRKKEFLLNVREYDSSSRRCVNPDMRDIISFGECVRKWLDMKKPMVKESTLAYYTVMAQNHIIPVLGSLSVSEITSEVLTTFIQEQKAHGRKSDGGALAGKTVSDLKMITKQILSYAKSCGFIDSVPDCRITGERKVSVSVLTECEQTRVERVLMKENNAFSLGVMLSLYGGLRVGEVCALRWEDFDFQNGTVQVSRTISRISDISRDSVNKTKVVIGTPKTDCSVRTIPLPEPVVQYLKERSRRGSAYLMTGTEKYMEPRVCLDRFKRLLRRAGVAEHTWHTLRHTFATRCVESGVDIKSLSEIMGHSNVKITLQRYVHPSMDSKKEQINKLPCALVSGQISGHEEREIA